MTDYACRLLSVFTLDGNRLSGNPLCVFEEGRGLDGATMQALAIAVAWRGLPLPAGRIPLEALRGVTDERYLAYVFAETGEGEIRARFFFPKGTAIAEAPATGSACANLGGWFLAQGAALPLTRVIRRGDAVGRPSRLILRVDSERRIFVSGEVIELGRGVVAL